MSYCNNLIDHCLWGAFKWQREGTKLFALWVNGYNVRLIKFERSTWAAAAGEDGRRKARLWILIWLQSQKRTKEKHVWNNLQQRLRVSTRTHFSVPSTQLISWLGLRLSTGLLRQDVQLPSTCSSSSSYCLGCSALRMPAGIRKHLTKGQTWLQF